MLEQMDEKLKKIEATQFITPKEQLGYAEEYITIKLDKPDESLLLNYSLSNSMEDIKMAIFNRTGHDIKLEKAKWVVNPYLSVSVKHLMNKHQVIYSMTTYYEKTVRIIVINMKVGDKWFYTSYGETDGKCHSWDYYEMMEKVNRVIKEIKDEYQIDDDE